MFKQVSHILYCKIARYVVPFQEVRRKISSDTFIFIVVASVVLVETQMCVRIDMHRS